MATGKPAGRTGTTPRQQIVVQLIPKITQIRLMSVPDDELEQATVSGHAVACGSGLNDSINNPQGGQ